MKGNIHVKAPTETPVANLMLTLAARFGCEMDKFGISTGRVEI